MADYNVNMKQWNGTSFDNVLPLAYLSKNSNNLNGKSLDEINKLIKSEVKEELKVEVGVTINTSHTREEEIKLSRTPSAVFIATVQPKQQQYGKDPRLLLTTIGEPNSVTNLNAAIINDGFLMVGEGSSSSPVRYCYVAIGEGLDENVTVISKSGKFVVTKTGHYDIELHGGGGGGFARGDKRLNPHGGGGSGEIFKNVLLTQGSSYDVVIGEAGTNGEYYSGDPTVPATNGGKTSFGTYSVNGGGAATEYDYGTGSGSLGVTAVAGGAGGIGGDTIFNIYGIGGSIIQGSGYNYSDKPATAGVVYLKYLGT